MKVRLAKQIQEINECLTIFKTSYQKCDRMLTQLKLQKALLTPFENIQKLFSLDLRILNVDQLIERKNNLIDAIDDIARVESKLNLKIVRLKQMEEQNEFEEQVENPEVQDLPPPVVEPLPQYNLNISSINSNKKRLPQCEVQLTSRCAQLLDIWARNKGDPNESVDDKFDRLSKIIGTLKKSVKEIYQEEKKRTNTISLYDYQEFTQVKESLEKTKQENLELKKQNDKLLSENTSLKEVRPKESLEKVQVQTQTIFVQRNHSQENFQIDNCFKSEFSIDGSGILQKPRTELLQESIIKVNSLTDSVIEYTLDKQEEADSQQLSRVSHEQTNLGILTFSKRINAPKIPFITSFQLNSVQSKLKEMKQNRKRIIEDDNLWENMENMKL